MRTLRFFVFLIFVALTTSAFAGYPVTYHSSFGKILAPRENYSQNFKAANFLNLTYLNTNASLIRGVSNYEKSTTMVENNYEYESSSKSLVVIDSRILSDNLKESSFMKHIRQDKALDTAGLIAWGSLGALVGVIALKDSRVAGAFIGFGCGAAIGAISSRMSESY